MLFIYFTDFNSKFTYLLTLRIVFFSVHSYFCTLIIFHFSTCFMFRTIPATKMKAWVILKPFAADSWYVILAMVVIITFIMSSTWTLERAAEYDGCSISVLVAVAALCQQGTRA